MNKKIIISIAIISLIIIGISMISILGQSKNEHQSFGLTEVREVFEGNAWEIIGYSDNDEEISIFVYNPNGVLATKDKLFTNSVGIFSTIITNGGPLFIKGTYTVIANQTDNPLSHAQITFELTKPTIPI